MRSAGLLRANQPANEMGQEILAARGLDLSVHRSRTVSREILLGADLVIGMARQHVREAVVAAPEAWPRTFTLKELVRRGETSGPRSAEESLSAWLNRLSGDRTTADMMGSSDDDDIADPIGGPRAGFEHMVVEVDDQLERLVSLAWGLTVSFRPVTADVAVSAEAAATSAAAASSPEPAVRPSPPPTPEPVHRTPPMVTHAVAGMGAFGAGSSDTGSFRPPAGRFAAEAEPPAVEPLSVEPEPAVADPELEPVAVEPLPVEPEPVTRIAVGSDHAGLELKAHLVDHLRARGHEVIDLGTHTADSVDYPDFGARVARSVVAGDAEVGLCVCGTGIGIGIAANKVAGVRAAIVHDVTSAQMARRHNNANVICVGARLLGTQVASDTVDAFLATTFEGGRHQRRIDQISTLDRPAPGASFDDAEVFDIIAREEDRQNTTLQLIASENFTSPEVMAAQGSVLTNKYSEGYPGKRYYGGNAVVDEAENLARDRVKALFGAEHANVQPHSGANANMAVYLGLLEPGDTVLGMRLDQGGHLTHGSPVNFSGRLYRFVSYGVTESDERLDYDQIRDLARQERPKAIVAGATAYPRIIDPAPLRAICDEVGALLIFDAAHIAGLIAGGAHPNPVGFADVVTFTTHKTLRGPRSGCILSTEAHAKAIDKAVFPGLQGGPLMHVIAAKAVAFREASLPSFREYAARIVTNAQVLARSLAGEGFRLVSGGTDNHLMLVDLRPFDAELTGKEAQNTLDRAGITLNKNQIPGDPRSPFVTSGLRIGTPAVTTAGMGDAEMAQIATLIGHALRHRADDGAITEVREAVTTLCSKFTPYPHLAGPH